MSVDSRNTRALIRALDEAVGDMLLARAERLVAETGGTVDWHEGFARGVAAIVANLFDRDADELFYDSAARLSRDATLVPAA